MMAAEWGSAAAMRAQSELYLPQTWMPEPFHWISQTGGDGCCDVWFCRDYYFSEIPDEAHIEITTAGWAELFVNGRNVDNALLTPFVGNHPWSTVTESYDITRFMRAGKNTVAIDYAPRGNHCRGCGECLTDEFDRLVSGDRSFEELSDSVRDAIVDSLTAIYRQKSELTRHEAALEAAEKPIGQLAARFYGVYSDSTEFSSYADGSWLCRTGRRRLTRDGGEIIDSRKPEFRNGTATDDATALWTTAIETPRQPIGRAINVSPMASGLVLESPCVPAYGGASGGMYAYSFDGAIFGFIRLTLRDCQQGGLVRAGKLRYVCSGYNDEQAIGKFAPQTLLTIEIGGSSEQFSPSNIYLIEGLSLKQKSAP